MKIAIMQPYFYPYIGYFELIKSVDVFYIFDNVQYTRGWINRNKIRNHGWLTVPITKCPQKTKIEDVLISGTSWHKDHCAAIEKTYGKRADNPLYDHYRDMEPPQMLSDLLESTIKNTCKHLQINTKFKKAPNLESNLPLNSAIKKIISICQHVGATTYVNPSGGTGLYDNKTFNEYGIKLEFMDATKHENKLSILDLCLGDGLKCV